MVTTVITAAAPPCLLGAFDHRWFTAHPALFAAATVGYWVMLAVLRFAARILQIPADRLVERWGNGISDAVMRHISRYERAYRASLDKLIQHMDNTALRTFGPRSTRLDDVYVDVSIAGDVPPGKSPVGVVASVPDSAQRFPIWEFIGARKACDCRQDLHVILGWPGSGKTTLLRHIARRACAERLPSRSRHRRTVLPVLLLLNACAAAIVAGPELSLPALIDTHAKGLPREPVPPGWFARQLKTGRCVVMFDGLDEVPGQPDRRAILNWLHIQVAKYQGNDFLLTSRPGPYREEHAEAAHSLQVREFTPEQTGAFIHHWYRTAHRHRVVPGGDRDAAEQADDLIVRIANAKLTELAANPLLLTMMVNIDFYNEKKLPRTRNELYRQMCRVMLEQRKLLAGNPPAPMSAEDQERVLGSLAFAMIGKKPRKNDQRGLGAVGRALARAGSAAGPAEFLAQVPLTGLLIRGESGQYSFAHDTFREYLAAVHIANTDQVRKLTSNLSNPDWRGITMFYAAHAGAERIIEACLINGRIPALALAFDCADEASTLIPELQSRLDKLLSDASDPAAPPERRDLATAVIATRELRQVTQLTRQLTMCTRPVSRQLYALYRYQERGQYPPSGQGTEGSREAAVGVSARDAVAFPGWLNSVIADKDPARYQLPTRLDAAVPGFPGSPAVMNHCVWLAPADESGEPELWVPAGAPHPYLVSGDLLRRRAEADMVGRPIGREIAALLAFALAHTLSVADKLADRYALSTSSGRAALREERVRVEELSGNLVNVLDSSEATKTLLTSVFNDVMAGALRRDLGLAADVASADLAPERLASFALDQALTRATELGQVLGVTLKQAVGQRFYLTIPRPGRATVVSRAFKTGLDADLDEAFAGDLDLDVPICLLYTGARELEAAIGLRQERAVTLAMMSQLAHDGRRGLEDLTPDPDLEYLRKRAARVAAQLESRLPAHDTISLQETSGLRLGALAVAAAAHLLAAGQELVRCYVDIAAGVTALEDRLLGWIPPTEILVLVRA